MSSVIQYFRRHAWQRRLLTGSASIVAGVFLAVVLYPHARDYLLIRSLANANAPLRRQAIAQASVRAAQSQRFARRLEAALETKDDRQFAAVVTSLRRIGRFDTPGRDPILLDRMRAIEVAQTRSETDPEGAATTRGMILAQVLLGGRDNRYVRQALSAAAVDDSAANRQTAALLAAKFGEDSTLRTLMDDADPTVQAAAALDAGLGGRTALTSVLAERMRASADPAVTASAACALAILAQGEHSAEICRLLRNTEDPLLRSRLLHVMTILADDIAGRTVGDLIESETQGGEFPSASTIIAAAKLQVPQANAAILATAAEASREGTQLLTSQAIAAFEAACRLGLDVRAEADAFCRKRWGPVLPLALIAAVKATAAGPEPPTGEQIATLRRAATYEFAPDTQPTSRQVQGILTPVPSAAAAVALWRIGVPLAGEYVRNVAAYPQTLPGDYVAWHLGRLGGQAAFDLGLEMLPSPQGQGTAPSNPSAPVFNENERSAGAMLLALAARTPAQGTAARQRIESRLGGPLGGEDDFFVRGAYQCALLMLGDTDRRLAVRELLSTPDFPQRRAATSLLAIGDKHALDWMFWAPQRNDADVAFLLINKGIDEVLAVCAPTLPTVDRSAGEDLLHWQVRILRDAYALRRETIELGLRP